ncbi:hypothetical protein LIA77_09071 [Sarocladium implicatum]|nr:hypothetical protein LIA77_09071 [Sarocladium implicatum]
MVHFGSLCLVLRHNLAHKAPVVGILSWSFTAAPVQRQLVSHWVRPPGLQGSGPRTGICEHNRSKPLQIGRRVPINDNPGIPLQHACLSSEAISPICSTANPIGTVDPCPHKVTDAGLANSIPVYRTRIISLTSVVTGNHRTRIYQLPEACCTFRTGLSPHLCTNVGAKYNSADGHSQSQPANSPRSVTGEATFVNPRPVRPEGIYSTSAYAQGPGLSRSAKVPA